MWRVVTPEGCVNALGLRKAAKLKWQQRKLGPKKSGHRDKSVTAKWARWMVASERAAMHPGASPTVYPKCAVRGPPFLLDRQIAIPANEFAKKLTHQRQSAA